MVQTIQQLKVIEPAALNPPLAPILVTSKEQLSEVANFLEVNPILGLDLETNVTRDFYDRRIRTIQFGHRERQYVIDLLSFAGSSERLVNFQGNYGANSEVFGPVIEILREFIEDKKWLKIGHNLSFEYEALRWSFGLRLHGMHDLMLAEQNIYAGLVHFMQSGFWGLDDLVARYTGMNFSEWKEYQKSFDLETPLTEGQIHYCGLDVRLPIAVYNRQKAIIEKEKLSWAVQIDCDAISPFGEMHLRGFNINKDLWRKKIEQNEAWKERIVQKLDSYFIPVVGTKYVTDEDVCQRDQAEAEWRACTGKTDEDKTNRKALRMRFYALRRSLNDRIKAVGEAQGEAAINYASPTQLRDALYKMGFKKSQLPDTNDRTLTSLAKFRNLTLKQAFTEDPNIDYPVIDVIRLYRSVDKELGTYGETWINDYDWKSKGGVSGVLHPQTGRIHSRFNIMGAATGRTSSTAPNIQNCPAEKEFRSAFTARPGYKILTIDFSGCELRILAEMSQDPLWLDAFKNNRDVHSVGAEILFGQKWKDAADPDCAYFREHSKCDCKGHKKLRSVVKSMNFGLAYGMGPSKLADELGISTEEAKNLLGVYQNAFPTVINFLNRLGNNSQQTLTARTLSGRRRRWQEPTWEFAKKSVIEKDKIVEPSQEQVRKKLKGMFASISREGKNGPIQGLNADIAKRAMYLVWLDIELRFGAYLVNMVHDELVVECPSETAEDCFAFISSTMTAAGAEFVKLIPMTTEGHIDVCWTK